MNRRVCIVLLLLMVFSLPFAANAGEVDAGFRYALDASGNAVITGFSGTVLDISVPASMGGASVTAIGNAAFMNQDKLVSVTLPEGLRSIGDSAFKNCRSLTEINIPLSVREIGTNAFENCVVLQSAVVPEGVTELRDRVFLNAGLQTVTLPQSLKRIGAGALARLENLTALELPGGLVSIGMGAFAGSRKLESIVVPSTVEEIGASAFHSSLALKSVVLPVGIKETTAGLFHDCPNLERVVFPDSARRIDPGMLFVGSPKVSVYAFKGSAAEGVARALRLPFVAVEPIRQVALLHSGVNAAGGVVGIDLLSNVRTVQLTAQISSDSPWSQLEWRSSAGDIASVSHKGLVTAHRSGTATITVSTTDGSGTIAQTVVNIANLAQAVSVSGITEMKAGESTVLQAVVQPEQADNKQVSWKTSHPDIVTIAANGKATAAKRVPAITVVTVTAQAKDGSGAAGTHDVTVYPLAYGISLKAGDQPVAEKATIGIDLSSGQPTVQLNAAVVPADAMQAVTFKSSANKIATVSDSGLLTGLAKGKADITVSAQDGSGIKAVYRVNVANMASSIVISGSDAVASGKTITLKAGILPDTADNKKVTWTSSDTSIAKVSDAGKVTAQKTASIRQVQITATAKDGSGVSATHNITVHPVASAVLISAGGMPLGAKTTVTMDLGTGVNTLQLEAATDPQDAAQGVAWLSSNKAVASVDENGLLTGHKKGTATITATSTDGSNKKASFMIKVMTLAKELSITGDTTVQGGDWIRLKAEFTPDTTDEKRLTWTSSDTKAASVSRDGVVNAKRVTAITPVTITATAQDGSGVTAQYDISVLP